MAERFSIGTFKYEGSEIEYTFFRCLNSTSVAVEDSKGNRWTVEDNLNYLRDIHRDGEDLTQKELLFSVRHAARNCLQAYFERLKNG